MKKVTDNIVNQQILSGHFPKSKLIPLNLYQSPFIDVDSIVKEGVRLLKEELRDFLPLMFSNASSIIQVFDNMGITTYSNEIYYWINLGCSIRRLNEDTTVAKDAKDLYPAVTQFDKILLHYAERFMNYTDVGLMNSEVDYFQLALTFGYLLLRVQRRELESGYTIKYDAIDSSELLLKSILGEWDGIETDRLNYLTQIEKKELQVIIHCRQDMLTRYQEERINAKIVSEKTFTDWKSFIQLLNALSKEESSTIAAIKDSTLPPELKIKAISEYYNFIKDVHDEKVQIDNQPISLSDIHRSMKERNESAINYVCLADNNETPFRLSIGAFALVIDPSCTFNFLFIRYHNFRLHPTKDNAMRFVSCAVRSLMNNLDIEDNPTTSFDEMIDFFCTKAISFIEQQKKTINEMSFQTLQEDEASIVSGVHASTYLNESFNDHWRELISAQIAELENGMNGNTLPSDCESYSEEEVLSMLQKEEIEYQKMEDAATARRIIVSINIIYMMRKVLRMIIDNEELKSMYNDLDALEQFERKLYKIDSRIERVYSYLDDEEREMSQYREEEGFDPERLARKESEEEKKRNEQVFEKVLNAVNIIMQDIEKQDIKGLLQKKESIRIIINECPECEAKEHLAVPIDNAITSLCMALISNCKKNADSFSEAKAGLVDYLGKDGHRLTEKALDTLTTAEILYNRYARNDYADEGFDYSSISALYYQAFEAAINDLIWKQYADYLNELIKNGRTDAIFRGYLPGDEDNVRKNYMMETDGEPQYQVVPALMLGNYKYLLKEVKEEGSARGFCKYFAYICGFHDESEMFNDKGFINDLKSFRFAINEANRNRNKASHGGNIIDRDRCHLDRVAVLSDLEEVRRNNIGLIQQLLYIVP